MTDPSPAEPKPLDDIGYLARSANRVTVLRQLADGPLTRRALHDETDVSQPTLGRVLDGFEDRGWATCDRTNGREYALTPLGQLLLDSFDPLHEAVGTIQRLRPVADRLPLDEMDFDVRRLADATVTEPDPSDAMAHLRREDELIEAASRVRFLCASAYAPSIQAYRDRFVGGDQRLEAIITADALDAAAEAPETANLVTELAAAETVEIYRYEGSVSLMLGRIDDVASLVPLDESGVPAAFIESSDPAVLDWVSRELDRYEAASTRVESPEPAEPPATD